MNVIQANDIKAVYGSDLVFGGVSFFVQPGERIGIVGANGTGKSTLLKIIKGEIQPAGGNLTINAELRTGYLKQGREGRAEDGSGGERAKKALEDILSARPDILLLDEPTNHLDFEKLAWLEGRLRHFKGTILLVSHDRYFLDRTVTRIFDMGNGTLKTYKGNYSAFREKKTALNEAAEKAFQNAMTEYKRQEEIIRKMKERGTEKLAKRAASREKKLLRESRPEAVQAHDSEGRRMRIRFDESRRSGNDVLFAENLSKSFNDKRLFENIGFDIKHGETVCMIGANGVGKTTLFRILTGKLAQDEGYFECGTGVRIGYYDQHQENLNGENTLLEEMQAFFPKSDDTEHRSLLGAFLFSGDKVFQKINTLSGGEKARLSLLKLIRSGANTLLLDEPTNHLDIASMEVVETALKAFPGTLFIISHDRYLLETLPDRIVELTPGRLISFPGGFDYYLEKRGQQVITSQTTRRDRDEIGMMPMAIDEWAGYKPETGAARERRLAKEAEAAVRRQARQLKETEAAIDAAEKRITELESTLNDEKNATNHEFLAEVHVELTDIKKELDALLIQWEKLH